MTYREILTLVSKGEPLPLFQTLADRLCYESLAKLKAEYELAGLGEKQVKIRKQEIRRAHEVYTEAHRQYLAVYREYNENCRRVGGEIREILEGLKRPSPDYPQLFQKAMNCLGILCNDSAAPQIVREAMKQKTSCENY